VKTLRISRESYLNETSTAQRTALQEALNTVIARLLSQGQAVWLEGFGVVFPRTGEHTASYNIGSYAALRKETVRTIDFEKCDDITHIADSRFPDLAGTSELAAAA